MFLVKGLLEGAISKVHINRLSTKETLVTQGVRQGDISPLALLFALTTQPLMDYLQFKISIGDIDGVKITKELIICHRLFADNVGIFISKDERSFSKLQEALSLYRVALGEKLNLAKSIIIMLRFW